MVEFAVKFCILSRKNFVVYKLNFYDFTAFFPTMTICASKNRVNNAQIH